MSMVMELVKDAKRLAAMVQSATTEWDAVYHSKQLVAALLSLAADAEIAKEGDKEAKGGGEEVDRGS